jgi:hypothetical protein
MKPSKVHLIDDVVKMEPKASLTMRVLSAMLV